MFDKPKKSKDVVESLRKGLPKNFKLMSFYEQYSATMKLSGVLVYIDIGAFIGILFMLSTGSIIYYKQLVEANDDKERYVILKNIGISKEEIREAIAKQMRVVFGLPLLISICHSAVALKALENMLLTNIFIYCAMVMAVYIIVYIIYYYVTVNSYTKIIES